MIKVIIVGFKVEQDRSALYKKVKLSEEEFRVADIMKNGIARLSKPLVDAYVKGCDFVSVRFVRE